MASVKQQPSFRYNTFHSFSSSSPRSSAISDPSSSTDTLSLTTNNTATHTTTASSSSSSRSRALIKTNNATHHHNFTSMVKKFMQTKSAAPSSSSSKKLSHKASANNEPIKLTVAAELLAQDLKKTTPLSSSAKRTAPLSALHHKLFKQGGEEKSINEKTKKKMLPDESRKPLTEVKGNYNNNNNTRTLAMVLRSERDLLSLNKDQEDQISQLKLLLDDRNREYQEILSSLQKMKVEKLKDLCLKQREEIKSLKSAILFPDVMNSQLQELVATQDSELKQAKQLVPNLQRQVTSLTAQLQCLADDLAEVKADKCSVRGYFDCHSSPRTPTNEHEEAMNSLEFSSGGHTAADSPDDMFFKDLNPCVTPYYKTKSMEFEEFDIPDDEGLFRKNLKLSNECGFNSCARKVSKSSDCCRCPKTASSSVPAARRSDESKCNYGKQMQHKFF